LFVPLFARAANPEAEGGEQMKIKVKRVESIKATRIHLTDGGGA
jgi:hypothetical protein